MSYTEFEAKFYFIDKEQYRSQLREIGAVLVHPEKLFRRSIYESTDKSTINGDYARVRDEGDKITLSIKTHAKELEGMDAQQEIVLTVDNFDAANDLLKALNLRCKAYQETTRETWILEGAEITIDTWPGLEPYTEIEAENEEKVFRIARILGVDALKKSFRSVSYLYQEVYGIDEDTVNNATPRITFEELPTWARKTE